MKHIKLFEDFKTNNLEEYCLNWLNDKFGDLKPEKQNLYINYIDKDDNIIFYYNKFEYDLNKTTYNINYEKTWIFFEKELNMSFKEIQEITSKWISNTYNLKKLPTKDKLIIQKRR